MRLVRTSSFLLSLLLATSAVAGISIPRENDRDTIIVATIETDMPEGATFNGGWKFDKGISHLPAPDKRSVHLCGSPGDYTIQFVGYWVHTKDVTFKDGDGNKITITSYLGSGFVSESTEFTIKGKTAPDPKPPAPPLPPPTSSYTKLKTISKAEADKISDPTTRVQIQSLYTRIWTRVNDDLVQPQQSFVLVSSGTDDILQSQSLRTKWKPWRVAVTVELVKLKQANRLSTKDNYLDALSAIGNGLTE